MALQTVKTRELGKMGVISDLPHSETPVSAWSDARNIKFNNSQVMKSKGYTPVFYNNREESGAVEYDGLKQIPMHLELKPETTDNWIYFTNNMIWDTDGWSHTKRWSGDKFDIPFDAPWSSVILSNSIIAYSSQLPKPIGQGTGGDSFKPLANWGPWSAGIVSSYKSFAFALGGGDEYPQRVRWSNIVPPRALPADWGWKYEYDEQDEEDNPEHEAGTPIPTTDPKYGTFIDGSAGGYNDLSFATGKIIDGAPLRDSFIIYTDEEVIICDYVGGNDIFRFRTLFEDGGAINASCVAQFDNKHFVVSPNDIYVHNGSTKESVINNKVRERLLEEITENSYLSVKVVPYLIENEIWIIYAGNDALGYSREGTIVAEAKEATKAAIYNYNNSTWSFIDIPHTVNMKLGPIPIYDEEGQNVKNWATIPEDYVWEDGIELWNISGGTAQNFKRHSILCASSDGSFYVMDRGDYFTTLDGKYPGTNRYKLKRTEITSDLTKYYIDMDELTDTSLYKTILAIWPQVQGDGELFIQVGGSHVSDGPIAWGDSVRFICGQDRKVDLRSNYRYLSLKIQSKGTGDWRLFGMDTVVRIGGKR